MGTRRTENEIPIFLQPPPPPRIELPGNVTANILQRLGTEEIFETAQKVCTTWWKVCKDPAMWRVVDLNKPCEDGCNFDTMCRCAVDRSHGQLTDLSITRFGEDELLTYVAHRSSHLRRLTIAHSNDISASALVEAVKRLPQLEELHLIAIRPLGAKYVETIGISCPLLKSFTSNELWGAEEDDCNGIALAVSKTMPNLHHLQISGDPMKNEGLEAILDGCPHLELLVLVNSSGLDLRGALGERCSKQIKFMRSRSLLPSYDELFDNYYDTLDDSDFDGFDAILDGVTTESNIDVMGMIMDSLQSLVCNSL